MSLNALCVECLATSGDIGALGNDSELNALMKDCVDAFGPQLEGLVLFGSLARGDATSASDADLLLVLSERVPVARSLYHAWDGSAAAKRRLRGCSVSPQFVALPATTATPGGLWYEVALDGRLLWDRHGRVGAALSRLRHEVASGAVERRETHGHPYWVRR